MTYLTVSGYWNRLFARRGTACRAPAPAKEDPVRMTREDALLCAFASAADVYAICGMGAGMSGYYICVAEALLDRQDRAGTEPDRWSA